MGRISRRLSSAVLLGAVALAGCAHVPPRAAELSTQLNTQIVDMQKVHIALVNRYFDAVESQMRQTIQTDYKNGLVQIMTEKEKAKGKDLTIPQYDKIIARVLERQDTAITGLEKIRSQALSDITDRYVLMRSEGQQIQHLLDSASKLQQERHKYTAQAETKMDSGVNFIEKVDATIQSGMGDAVRVKAGLDKIKDDAQKDAKEIINGNSK